MGRKVTTNNQNCDELNQIWLHSVEEVFKKLLFCLFLDSLDTSSSSS